MRQRSARAYIGLFALGAFALAAMGCTSGGGAENQAGNAAGSGGAGTGGQGAPCATPASCAENLTCNPDGTCQPLGSVPAGSPCQFSAQCGEGQYCDPVISGACSPAGSGKADAPCTTDGDCEKGLRCTLNGFEASCQTEGSKQLGEDCTSNNECGGGLGCLAGKCANGPKGIPPFGYTTWPGETCEDADTVTDTLSYFRVPRGQDDGDFYRLPFPNDIRATATGLDLSTHPKPGNGLLGFDPVDLYLRALEKQGPGYGLYPTVYFRFSKLIDTESLKGPNSVKWVDVTPGNTMGQEVGFSWFADNNRGAYICQHWLGVRPATGQLLKPGHTYAVLIGKGAKEFEGATAEFGAAGDFSAMLAGSAPSDGALEGAYAKYKPLRDYLTSSNISPDTLINAAVFTAGDPAKGMQNLATAVNNAPVAATSGWVKCGNGASPCSDTEGNRACGAGAAEFDEYHALVKLPVFQQGEAPYVESGGSIPLGSPPAVVREEEVCMALTVPKGTMPMNGWPVAVYGHGTGGNFRSHINEGLAARLATAPTPMAVIGIDQVVHGPRRGASTESPDRLFFNFKNPDAALGNPLQGAADQLSLLRMAQALNLDAASSPTGSALTFDPAGIVFWGHSQGATEGGISVPYSPHAKGVIFTGQGASLIDSLLTKTEPVNIAKLLPFGLQDPSALAASQGKVEVSGNNFNPVLNILQMYIDPADPMTHAVHLRDGAMGPGTAKHVFMAYGTGDSFSTPITQETYANAANLRQVTPATSTPDTLKQLEPQASVSGNWMADGTPFTGVVRQYSSDGSYDGHFVGFRNPTAQSDINSFLNACVSGMTPTVSN